MRNDILDKVPQLPKTSITPVNTPKNPHLLRNCLGNTEASPVGPKGTITINRPKYTTEALRVAGGNATIGHTGLLLTVATETGMGTGTVIAMEETIHLVAGATREPTRMTTVDTPLPRVATLEFQTDTVKVNTVKAHATETRGKKTMITVMDLLAGIDRPAGGTTTMTTKILKNAGDADTRGGNAKRNATRIGIMIGGSTKIGPRSLQVSTNRRPAVTEAITGAMLEVISTTPQVYTKANTGPRMTMTRCRSQIRL
jgi:hypothetical protein